MQVTIHFVAVLGLPVDVRWNQEHNHYGYHDDLRIGIEQEVSSPASTTEIGFVQCWVVVQSRKEHPSTGHLASGRHYEIFLFGGLHLVWRHIVEDPGGKEPNSLKHILGQHRID